MEEIPRLWLFFRRRVHVEDVAQGQELSQVISLDARRLNEDVAVEGGVIFASLGCGSGAASKQQQSSVGSDADDGALGTFESRSATRGRTRPIFGR